MITVLIISENTNGYGLANKLSNNCICRFTGTISPFFKDKKTKLVLQKKYKGFLEASDIIISFSGGFGGNGDLAKAGGLVFGTSQITDNLNKEQPFWNLTLKNYNIPEGTYIGVFDGTNILYPLFEAKIQNHFCEREKGPFVGEMVIQLQPTTLRLEGFEKILKAVKHATIFKIEKWRDGHFLRLGGTSFLPVLLEQLATSPLSFFLGVYKGTFEELPLKADKCACLKLYGTEEFEFPEPAIKHIWFDEHIQITAYGNTWQEVRRRILRTVRNCKFNIETQYRSDLCLEDIHAEKKSHKEREAAEENSENHS